MERTITIHFDDKTDAAPKIWADIMELFKREHFSCATNHLLLSYDLTEEKFPDSDVKMIESKNKNLLHEVHKSIFEFDDPESATMDFINELTHTEGMKAFIFKKADDGTNLGMCFLLVEKHSACLCGFGIIPAYQGQGYGAKSLKLICNYLSEISGIEHINVEVNGLNERALGLYKKFGFKSRESYSEFEYIGE